MTLYFDLEFEGDEIKTFCFQTSEAKSCINVYSKEKEDELFFEDSSYKDNLMFHSLRSSLSTFFFYIEMCSEAVAYDYRTFAEIIFINCKKLNVPIVRANCERISVKSEYQKIVYEKTMTNLNCNNIVELYSAMYEKYRSERSSSKETIYLEELIDLYKNLISNKEVNNR